MQRFSHFFKINNMKLNVSARLSLIALLLISASQFYSASEKYLEILNGVKSSHLQVVMGPSGSVVTGILLFGFFIWLLFEGYFGKK